MCPCVNDCRSPSRRPPTTGPRRAGTVAKQAVELSRTFVNVEMPTNGMDSLCDPRRQGRPREAGDHFHSGGVGGTRGLGCAGGRGSGGAAGAWMSCAAAPRRRGETGWTRPARPLKRSPGWSASTRRGRARTGRRPGARIFSRTAATRPPSPHGATAPTCRPRSRQARRPVAWSTHARPRGRMSALPRAK